MDQYVDMIKQDTGEAVKVKIANDTPRFTVPNIDQNSLQVVNNYVEMFKLIKSLF